MPLFALAVILSGAINNRTDCCLWGCNGDVSVDKQLSACCDALQSNNALEFCRFGLVGDESIDELVMQEDALLPK